MKTIPLDELLRQIRQTKLTPQHPHYNGTKRVHPHVCVGNGDGHNPMPEISIELTGGDWLDIAYCHHPQDAALLAHAANVLPEVVEALRALTDWGRTHTSPLDANSPHALLIQATEAIAKATAVPV